MSDVFVSLVGQEEPVETLRRAAAAAAAVVAGSPAGGGDDAKSCSAAVSVRGSGSVHGAADQNPAAMTHAWIFTGPPGSGRSVAARAFAAALQCETGIGCGTCHGCHTTLTGTHADVRFLVPEGLSIGVGEMRAMVLRAASAPAGGRWQVLVVEDADRLTEQAGNALLKAIEEPPPRTVFLLCTPSTHPDDISVTIRSRCRVVPLRQPSAAAVASVLRTRDAVAQDVAEWAAAAAQGHVGRARRLARDPDARARRDAVLAVPRRLTGVGACFDAANALIEAAEAEAAATVAEADATERAALETALGAGGTGRGAAGAIRGAAGQLKELERRQKSRLTRAQRDALDRALVDLAGFYRDVLALQFGELGSRTGKLSGELGSRTGKLSGELGSRTGKLSGELGSRTGKLSGESAGSAPPAVPAVHVDTAETAQAAARRWTPEGTLRRLEAVLACRDAIDANVKPRIAVEAMMLTLWRG